MGGTTLSGRHRPMALVDLWRISSEVLRCRVHGHAWRKYVHGRFPSLRGLHDMACFVDALCPFRTCPTLGRLCGTLVCVSFRPSRRASFYFFWARSYRGDDVKSLSPFFSGGRCRMQLSALG